MAPAARPHFPASLEYRDELRVQVPRRGEVPLARFSVRFNASPKPLAAGFQQAWASRPQVSCDGQAMFPEIAVLSLFQKQGWDGVWADVPRRRYFNRMPSLSKGATLDAHVAQQLSRISAAGEGTGAACWELIIWHGHSLFFAAVRDAPALAAGGAPLRKAEMAWLEAGLRAGLVPQQFVLVEWDYRRVVVGRRKQPGSRGQGPSVRP